MSTKSTPKKFAMQQVFEFLLRKPTDKSVIAYLTDAKTSGLEKTAELVYPTGARGNVYVGGAFAHTQRAKFNVTVATWNTEVFAAQNGTVVSEGTQEITVYDVVTATSAGTTLTLSSTPKGATGAEVGFLYLIDEENGMYSATYTQVASTPTATSFTVSGNTITLGASATAGASYACAYVTDTATSKAQKISVTTDGIPALVLVTAYGLAMEPSTGELFPCQVNGKAQIDPNYTFDLSSDGEPTIQSLNMEFIKPWNSNKLYDFIVYTDETETI